MTTKREAEINITFLIEWLQEDEDNVHLLPEDLVEEFLRLTSPNRPPRVGNNEETVDFVKNYGGNCRDCADTSYEPVCDHDGLPCGGSDKAIRHVLKALDYGIEKGYLRR